MYFSAVFDARRRLLSRLYILSFLTLINLIDACNTVVGRHRVQSTAAMLLQLSVSTAWMRLLEVGLGTSRHARTHLIGNIKHIIIRRVASCCVDLPVPGRRRRRRRRRQTGAPICHRSLTSATSDTGFTHNSQRYNS